MNTHPKASVLIITYNHEKYIREAVMSVLKQKTSFDIEIVIADDCSTDKTSTILKDLQNQYPDRINLLLRNKNLGMNRNFWDGFVKCHGEYVGLLEGDDYWIDPYKLEKQVDLLVRTPQATICFGKVKMVDENGDEIGYYPFSTLPNLLDVKFYLSFTYNIIHFGSAMVKSNLIEDMPDGFFELALGDWPFFIKNLLKGPAIYCNQTFSAWRHHRGGTWTTRKNIDRYVKTLNAAEYIIKNIPKQYKKQIDKFCAYYLVRIVQESSINKIGDENFTCAKKAITKWKFLTNTQRIGLWKIILIYHFPSIYSLYKIIKQKYA